MPFFPQIGAISPQISHTDIHHAYNDPQKSENIKTHKEITTKIRSSI
jgi:hypothetical protein